MRVGCFVGSIFTRLAPCCASYGSNNLPTLDPTRTLLDVCVPNARVRTSWRHCTRQWRWWLALFTTLCTASTPVAILAPAWLGRPNAVTRVAAAARAHVPYLFLLALGARAVADE